MTRFLVAILSAVLFAGAVSALQPNPLRDRLLRNDRSAELTGWYQRADTGEFFLFDRSGEAALLRERDAQDAEVLVLYPNRAPGGGTAYITDTGREVIRITGRGGATYFPADAPDGVIVEFASPSGAMTPTPRAPGEVRDRAEALAEYLAYSLNRDLQVEYSPAPRAGLGVQFDAFNLIERAFALAGTDRRRTREVEHVNIVLGSQPGAERDGGALVVTIVPELGFAGRPSSAYIAEAILNPI